jgi:abortive infection bacteriophage resistance protein
MASYDKPHLSYEQQRELLQSRGLICADEHREIGVLKAAGYYHFSAYVYPFRQLLAPDAPRSTRFHYRSDEIIAGATFDQVEKLWRFDRALRTTWLDGLQIVEVAVRTQVAYVLGRRDPFGHTNRDALDDKACNTIVKSAHPSTGEIAFDLWIEKYEKLRSAAAAEDFVSHNILKYDGQLPVWIIVEFLDFGALARLYSLLKQEDKREVAKHFGFTDASLFHTLLLNLNNVRNCAAHHGRLWNRVLTYQVPKFKEHTVPPALHHVIDHEHRDKVYVPLAVTAQLAHAVDSHSNWPLKMRTHLKKFPTIEHLSLEGSMGFPDGWAELPVWKPT